MALGASFDPDLVEAVGVAVAKEALAKQYKILIYYLVLMKKQVYINETNDYFYCYFVLCL